MRTPWSREALTQHVNDGSPHLEPHSKHAIRREGGRTRDKVSEFRRTCVVSLWLGRPQGGGGAVVTRLKT